MTTRSKRLERVLRVRRVQEEQARATWLEAENTARDAEDRTQELRKAKEAMGNDLLEALGELPPQWVMLSHDRIDHAGVLARDQKERALTLRTQADVAKEPWAERRAAAKGIERLVERVREEEWAEAHAEEARETDERNVTSHAKKRGGHQRSEA